MSGRCTICQEIFDPSEIAALKCGHTFHLHCISRWLQKPTSSCPVCRCRVAVTDIIQQLFFDYGEDSLLASPSPRAVSTSKQVSELAKKVQMLEKELGDAVKSSRKHKEALEKSESEVARLHVQNDQFRASERALQAELAGLDKTRETNRTLTAKNKKLQEQLKNFRTIECLINNVSQTSDISGTLEDCSVDVLKTSFEVMKKKYNDLVTEKQAMSFRMKEVERQHALSKTEKTELEALLKTATEEMESLKAAQAKYSTMEKGDHHPPTARSPSTARLPSSEDEDSLYNIYGQLPAFRMTNVAERAKQGEVTPFPKFSTPLLLDDSVNSDIPVSPIASPQIKRRKMAAEARKRPAKAGKPSAASTKRWDGLGGRAMAFENAPKKQTRFVTPAKNRNAAVMFSKAPKKPRKYVNKLERAISSDSDDGTIVLD